MLLKNAVCTTARCCVTSSDSLRNKNKFGSNERHAQLFSWAVSCERFPAGAIRFPLTSNCSCSLVARERKLKECQSNEKRCTASPSLTSVTPSFDKCRQRILFFFKKKKERNDYEHRWRRSSEVVWIQEFMLSYNTLLSIASIISFL